MSFHMLAGDIVSPESNDEVRRLMLEFLREQRPEMVIDPGGAPDE